MIDSRNLYDLQPFVHACAITFIARCETELKIKLLVTSTLRDEEEQEKLWKIGRTVKGRVVTDAKPGESAHNYGLALDVVPMISGKPIWDSDNPLWLEIGRIGKEEGFEWGGNWKSFKEYPHFQMLGGLTIAELKNGQSPRFA